MMMLACSLTRAGGSVAGRRLLVTLDRRSTLSLSRPFHSALKRQLKNEKKAKEKETKLAQAATQQKASVSIRACQEI